MNIKRTYGVKPNNQSSLVETIGASWGGFSKIFPVYFYPLPADMLIQVRKEGKFFDSATLNINIFTTDSEKLINECLNTAGVSGTIFQNIPMENMEFLYDLRKGHLVTPAECLYLSPPIESGRFLMWSSEKSTFFLSATDSSKGTFSTANYISLELSPTVGLATELGKEITLALISDYRGVPLKEAEMSALRLVDFPPGVGEGESIVEYAPEVLTALNVFRMKKIGKVKKKSGISLLNLIQTGIGIPKGLVDSNRNLCEVKVPIIIDSCQDRIEEAYLMNGKLYVDIIDRTDKEIYEFVKNIFKVPSIVYLPYLK